MTQGPLIQPPRILYDSPWEWAVIVRQAAFRLFLSTCWLGWPGRSGLGRFGRLWHRAFQWSQTKLRGRVTVKLHGRKAKINYGNPYPMLVRWVPTFNWPFIEAVGWRILTASGPINVVDVGAATGDGVLLLRERFGSKIANVICVEPDPEFWDLLVHNTAGLPAVNCNVALGSGAPMIRSMVRTHAGTASAQGEEMIAARTLDELLAEIGDPPVHVVKVDADGFDGEILKGAARTLEKHRPIVIFEWHPILCEQTGNDPLGGIWALDAANYHALVWFDKLGRFSHFGHASDMRSPRQLWERCVKMGPAMDWHYDVVALPDEVAGLATNVSFLRISAAKPVRPPSRAALVWRRGRRLAHLARASWSVAAELLALWAWKLRHPRWSTVAMCRAERMGDVVACSEIARVVSLTRPERTRIVWYSKPACAELARCLPVSEVHTIRCLTEWIWLMRLAPFDRVVNLHIQNDGCRTCGIRTPRTGGNVTFRDYYEHGNLRDIYAKVAGDALPEGDRAAMRKADAGPSIRLPPLYGGRLDRFRLPERFVVLHARSEDGVREWLDDRWRELAVEIHRRTGLAVVEVGAAGKSALRSYLMPPWAVDLCGQTSIVETADVISRARAFVGVDSGPAHLANAVGTKGVVLLARYMTFDAYVPYSGGYANGNAVVKRKMTMDQHTVSEVADAVEAMAVPPATVAAGANTGFRFTA